MDDTTNWISLKLVAVVTFISLNVFAEIEDFGAHLARAKNEKLTMNERWSALLQASNFASRTEVSEIQKFAQSKEWYLRNAALVALKRINPELAQQEAVKLLSDKALVVRSAAVEVVAEKMTDRNKTALVSELNKAYNFNRNSSLWIRKQILEKVAAIATAKDQNLFVKTLFDQDKKISELSANTLEKLTGKKIARNKFVQNWRAYAKQENWY